MIIIPLMILTTLEDNQGNGNGLLDYGESVTLNISLKNIGTQPAADVTATLRCADTCITLTDSVETFGAFNPDQIISIQNAFGFSCPDQFRINIIVILQLSQVMELIPGIVTSQ